MPEAIARQYVRFVRGLRPSGDRVLDAALSAGGVGEPIFATASDLSKLITTAARRAAGLPPTSQRGEVLWVKGDSQLAVGLTDYEVTTADGLVIIAFPVRSDQTGREGVRVTFACGSEAQPAGLYAATHPRPQGPAVVVEAWGEHLVVFAWQCLLGVVAGLAGAVGRDNDGNVLVPAEIIASADGLAIVPMARHRFADSSAATSPAPIR